MLSCFFWLTQSAHYALDLGSQFIKSAFISNSLYPEIGLNYQSERQTPAYIAFRNYSGTLRPYFGEAAFQILESRPYMGSGFLPYFYDIPEQSLFEFNMNTTYFSFEEMNTFFFKQYLDCLSKHAEVTSVILIVPATYTLQQRNDIVKMVRSTGYNCDGVIDDADAIAYNYAIEKVSIYSKSPETVLFVDIGATKVSAFAEHFEYKNKGPLVHRLSYSSMQRIGGAFVTDHLRGSAHQSFSSFDSAKKKLLLSNRVSFTYEQSDGTDVSVTLTRKDLEKGTDQLSENVKSLIKSASQNLKIDKIEVIGGGSRLYGLEQKIGQFSHTMNAEEALVMGGAYTKSLLSQSIRINNTFSLFDINYNGVPVCKKGGHCLNVVEVNDSVVEVECNGKLSIVYELDKSDSNFTLFLSGNPPLLHHVEDSNNKNVGFTVAGERPVMTEAVRKILEAENERVRNGEAKSLLEQAIYRVLDRIEYNETFIEYTNETQRQELREMAESSKECVEGDKTSTEMIECRKNVESLENRVDNRIATRREIHKIRDQLDQEMLISLRVLKNETRYLKDEEIMDLNKTINRTEKWIGPWINKIESVPKCELVSQALLNEGNKHLKSLKSERRKVQAIHPSFLRIVLYWINWPIKYIINFINSMKSTPEGYNDI